MTILSVNFASRVNDASSRRWLVSHSSSPKQFVPLSGAGTSLQSLAKSWPPKMTTQAWAPRLSPTITSPPAATLMAHGFDLAVSAEA
jgi:hypothetical protein